MQAFFSINPSSFYMIPEQPGNLNYKDLHQQTF